MTSPLANVVHESARRQVTTHKVTAAVWMFLGGLFVVLSVFVRGKEDEQGMRVVAGIVGAVLVVLGAGYIKLMTARVATLVDLLLVRRSELRKPTLVVVRSRGRVIAHEIRVVDASNRGYRMRVPSEADARAMLANIQP